MRPKIEAAAVWTIYSPLGGSSVRNSPMAKRETEIEAYDQRNTKAYIGICAYTYIHVHISIRIWISIHVDTYTLA